MNAGLPATAVWLAAVIAVLAALVSAGVCLVLLGRLRRLVEHQQALEGQLGAMVDAVCSMEARLEGTPTIAGPAEESEEQPLDADGDAVHGESIDAEITPEIQAAIAAAAVVAAGDKARVHSVRRVKGEDERNAWSQQGRMLVQTSHNMRTPR